MKNKRNNDSMSIIFIIFLIVLAVLIFLAMAYGVMALDKCLQESKVVNLS